MKYPTVGAMLTCALMCAAPALAQVAATAAAPQAAALAPPASAPAANSADELALKLANPVANLISVPLQSNIDFGIGPSETYRYTLNVQPVIPFSVGENLNLITRTIMPIASEGSPAPGADGATGLGDIVQSFFISPKKPLGGMIIGVGPALMYASATDDLLGAGKWAAGPTAVVLKQMGSTTVGALVNHLKAFAGDDARSDVNATFLNPFVSYLTKTKTTFSFSPELTYDWESGQWVAPLNFSVAQLLVVGKKPISVSGGVRVYAATPDFGPKWGLRFGVTLLVPK